MRNLIVCCDGTWNTPRQTDAGIPVPTNVVRLYNALAERDAAGTPQLKYYHPGVGTEGGLLRRVLGGGMGVGLCKNVQSAYKWLGVNYRDNDRIFLFGFSRGAYTVRTLAGMLLHCGLPDLSDLPDDELWSRVDTAFQSYRRQAEFSPEAASQWRFHDTPPVYFIGVWDTVGALGIPDDLGLLLNLFDNPHRYAFHNAGLHPRIVHARHAVALDETRASYTPALWLSPHPGQDVKQLWFPGSHSDVGGGVIETGLADGALKWMIDEVRVLGLVFKYSFYHQIKPNHHDIIHDYARSGIYRYLSTQPRSIPCLTPAHRDVVHLSALKRRQNPPITQAPYRPTRLLQAGESMQVAVYAGERWNDTTLYLEAGIDYTFRAAGQWMSGPVKCGPAGRHPLHPAHWPQLAAALPGKLIALITRLAKRSPKAAAIPQPKEKPPWLALTGAIANGNNPLPDSTPGSHEIIVIKDGCSYRPRQSGYLYCFAHDAKPLYGRNRGCVMLTIGMAEQESGVMKIVGFQQ